MSKSSVLRSYAKSLGWITLLVAFLVMVSLTVHLVTFDFIHGNPNRTPSDVIEMLLLEDPLIAFVAVIGVLLVFTLPQFFQASLIIALCRFGGERARFWVLPLLPVTAVLTWYCYDYLTPTDIGPGFNFGPDWTPYQHGISGSRYLRTILFQTPVTLFSFLYFELGFRKRSRTMLFLVTFLLLLIAGGIDGWKMTADQIRLQQQQSSRQPQQVHNRSCLHA